MRLSIYSILVIVALSSVTHAQSGNVSFGTDTFDPAASVEVTADELRVDQTSGNAVFSGNVVAGQGEMRLSANEIRVEYLVENGATTSQIDRLLATGDVILVNGSEAAEAQEAIYIVGSGEVIMTGNVLLTQGNNALSGEKLIVDLNSGQGRIVGRVKTIFQTGADN